MKQILTLYKWQRNHKKSLIGVVIMAAEEYLFKFLEQLNYYAAEQAIEIEKRIFDDPKSAVINARLFAEEIVKEVLRKENIDYENLTTHFDRINLLSKEGIIERDIQQTLATIRITGNNAVHDLTYRVDILEAIKIFKEMYKLAVWFTEVYSMEIEVPRYRDPVPPKKGLGVDDVQLLINEAISGKLSQYLKLTKENEEEHNVSRVNTSEDLINKDETIEGSDGINSNDQMINKNLPEGRSYLLRQIKRLQESSQEAVENAKSFSNFKNYMHVERKIQGDFQDILNATHNTNGPELILLSGSVGDGKSHLLAYFNEKTPDILKKYKVLNDATESFSPNKNALETLSDLLDGFSDQNIDESNDKVILAINLGVLHNFLLHKHEEKTFNNLKNFIDDSELFTQKVTTKFSQGSFHLIGFSDYQSYELTDTVPTSSFFKEIFRRVFSREKNNPFFVAYEEDIKNEVKGIIHENFEFLMDDNVQNSIIQLVIQGIIKNKLVISARAFYNFISDIVIPEGYTELLDFEWNKFEKLKQTVPHLLFKRKDRSNILKTISNLDPIHIRSNEIDQIIIDLNTLSDWDSVIVKYTKNSIAESWLLPFANQSETPDGFTYEFSQTLVRLTYLTNHEFTKKVIPVSYLEYMSFLYSFNKVQRKKIETFYKDLIQAIYKWRGSPKSGFVYINKPNEKFRIAQELSLKPSMEHLIPRDEEILTSFKQTLTLVFLGGNTEKVSLEVDYPLYELLSKVQIGYCPNKKDEEDAIKFVEFLDQIMKFGKQSDEVLIHIPAENKQYLLSKGLFGGYVFEKGQG
jgi:DNA phosphorothioation-dependent restriction protein DptF